MITKEQYDAIKIGDVLIRTYKNPAAGIPLGAECTVVDIDGRMLNDKSITIEYYNYEGNIRRKDVYFNYAALRYELAPPDNDQAFIQSLYQS